MKREEVVKLYILLKENNIPIWIDGGWGVDALLEKETRPHKDLDIAIEEKDLNKFRRLLDTKGYKDLPQDDSVPHNFILRDHQGREIDVHVIVFDENGNGIYGPAENGQMYPASSLMGMGKIDGVEVKCISAEDMVKFHSGYELKDKDYKDVSALCDKFGIPLPAEYQQFIKKEYK